MNRYFFFGVFSCLREGLKEQRKNEEGKKKWVGLFYTERERERERGEVCLPHKNYRTL